MVGSKRIIDISFEEIIIITGGAGICKHQIGKEGHFNRSKRRWYVAGGPCWSPSYCFSKCQETPNCLGTRSEVNPDCIPEHMRASNVVPPRYHPGIAAGRLSP